MRLQDTGGFAAAGLFVLGLCAAWWSPAVAAEGGKAGAGAGVGEYTLSGPYTHENLTVWLIHGAEKMKGREFLTLEEALEQKVVVVHETGNVSELAIENVSPNREVYVQSGDIVKGGKQDRTISMDFIVPPGSGKMPVASFCVEQGRWRERGGEDVRAFSSSEYSLSNKSVKLAAKYAPPAATRPTTAVASGGGQAAARQAEQRASARGGGAYGQQAVWEAVVREQQKLSENVGQSVRAGASASSYQLSLENQKVREQADAYVKSLASAVEGKANVVGYAFAINGKVNSADVYGSRGLFVKLWPKLLRASAVEALAELKKGEKFDPASAESVKACIAEAEKGKESTRAVTGRVEMLTKESKDHLLFETRDKGAKEGEGGWVHRNYVAK